LQLAGYARSLEWLAAGKVFAALEALEAGLVSRVSGLGQALADARSLAKQFTANDPEAVRTIKRILRAGLTLTKAEALRLERETFPDLWAGAAHRLASAAFVTRRNHRPLPAEVAKR
jgi:enoyl-CoA hydratase/carnithine racemase